MELLFLGTGAGQLWPATFCTCGRCAQARREGIVMPGTSVLIDGQYLLDAPNGLALNLALLGVTPRFPFHVFITHSHPDHLSPGELLSTTNDPNHRIIVYLNETTRSLLDHYARFNRFFNLEQRTYYRLVTVAPFRPVDVQPGVSALPILAAHDTTYGETPLNYILQLHGKTLLYACDTGWYPEETWAAVMQHRFDVVVMECSYMATETGGRNHLDWAHFLRVVARLREQDRLAAGAQIVATHFHWHHFDEAKAAALRANGVQLAYRGMRLQC